MADNTLQPVLDELRELLKKARSSTTQSVFELRDFCLSHLPALLDAVDILKDLSASCRDEGPRRVAKFNAMSTDDQQRMLHVLFDLAVHRGEMKKLNAEYYAEIQRIHAEVAAIIALIPASCRVPVREGGGQEDPLKTLAGSVGKMADELDRVRLSEEMSTDCFNMIRDELARIGCCHGDGDHAATPPMMFNDWIRCAVAKREQEITELKADNAELRARNAKFREWVPTPDRLGGWTDPSAPEEHLRDVIELAEIWGEPLPPHLAELKNKGAI